MNKTSNSVDDRFQSGTLSLYVTTLLGYALWPLLTACSLLVVAGITEGVGLLLLVPFLQLVNPGAETVPTGGITGLVRQIFETIHLPMTLPSVLGIFVVLVVGRALLLRWRDILLMDIQLGFVDYLRYRIFSAIARTKWLALAKRNTSDFGHVLTSDIDRVSAGTHFFLTLLVSGLMAAVYILVALRLSALMTLLALVVSGLMALLVWPQIKRARVMGMQLTDADQQVYATIRQFLDGIKIAKSYGAEDRHRQIFSHAIAEWRRQMVAFVRSDANVHLIVQSGAAVTISGLLYLAVGIMRLPATEIMVLVLIFARLLPILSGLQSNYHYFIHALPAFTSAMAAEAYCLAAAEPLPPPRATELKLREAISFHEVCFSYDPDGTRTTLAGIDLRIPVHQTTALVGSSGAGKSTLADLLIGLLEPQRGQIRVDGQRLGGDNLHAWRRRVAYVPQETFLFDDSVRANLTWVRPDAGDAELWDVLRLAAADEFVARLPQGLDTLIGERGIRLSGGERQRIALARALLYQPALLLLDEATSALDTEHERRIRQAIDRLHGELTIVVIAHRLSTVRHVDQIVVLEAGRIVEVGTWEELCQRPEGRLPALVRAAG